jgi:LacI family transcriptional regulator
LVRINSSAEEGVIVVNPDDSAVGKMGCAHLVETGLSQLAYYGYESNWNQRRQNGFQDYAEARSLPCMTNAFLGKEVLTNWAQLMEGETIRRFLSRLTPPVGVMAFNDRAAAEIIRVAIAMKWEVPEQLAVIGVDNDTLNCEFGPVSITSIDLDLRRIGFDAATCLIQAIERQRIGSSSIVVPPSGIVVRRSTDILAVQDSELRMALHLIRGEACKGITVADVLQKVDVSRARLERAFATIFGRTPAAEIRRLRMEKARELAQNTDLKLSAIAKRCGYRQGTHLSAAFKEEFGVTISQFRSSLIE